MLSQGGDILSEHLPMRPNKIAIPKSHSSISIKDGYRHMIETALEECNGNVSRTAKKLKIARSTLYRKMEEFGII